MRYQQFGFAALFLAGVRARSGGGLYMRRRSMRSLNFSASRTLLLAAIAFAATLFGQKITVTDPSPSLSSSKDITVAGRMMSLALSPTRHRPHALPSLRCL